MSDYGNKYDLSLTLWFYACYLLIEIDVWLKVAEISNGRRHVGADSENVITEEGQSSESVTNVCNSTGAPPHDYESSDTSLKLGWVQLIFFFQFAATFFQTAYPYLDSLHNFYRD